MAKKTPPDESTVYLALKNVFKGHNAEIRQLKAVRRLVEKNQAQQDVADLFRAHGIDTICNIARTLLTEKVFGSTVKAKIRFPEVFDISPAQSAEREASEAAAAISEASAIEDALHGHQDQMLEETQAAGEVERVETCREPKPLAPEESRRIPSLFPVYLPLRTQHRLLVKVQTILEHACFNFGKKAMPDVLQKNRWDCPESAELNIWAAEFLKRKADFLAKKGNIGKPLEKLFQSIAHIRHTAVHRLRISARGMQHLMLDAESLATLFGDTACMKLLMKLRRDIQLTTEELERNKHILNSKLAEALKKIAAQRAELDRLEEEAVTEMVKEDGEYQIFAGTSLEQSIESTETATLTGADMENEGSPDTEDCDSVEGLEDSNLGRQQD